MRPELLNCLHAFAGQIPSPPTGAMESWLLSAAAVMSLLLLGKKLLVRKPPLEAEFVTRADAGRFEESVRRELAALRDRMDARFESLGGKLDLAKAELLDAGAWREAALHKRINQLEAGLARVDERTKTPA